MKIEEQKQFDLLQNEFIVNQRQVKTQIQKYKVISIIAVICTFLFMILSVIIVYEAIQITGAAKKVDKLVFKEDGSGGLTFMGMASNQLDIKNTHYIDAQMIEYVKALYSIPTDKDARQYNAYKVQYMTTTDYYAKYPQTILAENYTKNSENLVTVKVTTVGQVHGVWEVDWIKSKNNESGVIYKSLITFKQVDTGNNVEINYYNPLGIAITNIETIARIAHE